MKQPEWIRVVILFSALTVAATWPQAVSPAGIQPHSDSWLNMWRIAWIAHQLPRDPVHLFDANIFHPEHRTLAYSDATVFQGVIGSVPIWAGVPVPYVHTFLVLVSFVFSGIAAWALVRGLTGSSVAGIAAGVIFAFTPYRFDHYMHLELLWTGWMPLTLLAAHRVVERKTIFSGIVMGVLFAAQTWSCIYYAVFLATVLVPFTLVLAARSSWPDIRRLGMALGVGAVVSAVPVLPYLDAYREVRTVVGERSPDEASFYSAGPAHYLAATPDNLIYGSLTGHLGRDEKRLFPGLIATALTLVALWPPIDRRRAAYAAALLLALDLSFGPRGLTYDWLRELVMPYRGLRAPARAGAVALLMIAALAGFGWSRLEQTLRRRDLAHTGALGALVLMAMSMEYLALPRRLIDAPTQPAPVYTWLAHRTGPGATIELPLPELPRDTLPRHDAEFMYQSTFHWRPLVNGYSGNVPASYLETLRAMHDFPSAPAIERLRKLGVRYVLVHERLFDSNGYPAMISALEARPDVERLAVFGLPGEEVAAYTLAPPVRAGTQLPAERIVHD